MENKIEFVETKSGSKLYYIPEMLELATNAPILKITKVKPTEEDFNFRVTKNIYKPK